MSHSVTRSEYAVMAQPQHRGLFLVDTSCIVNINSAVVDERLNFGKGHRLSGFYSAHHSCSTGLHMWYMGWSNVCTQYNTGAAIRLAHDSCSQPSTKTLGKEEPCKECSSTSQLSVIPREGVPSNTTWKGSGRDMLDNFSNQRTLFRQRILATSRLPLAAASDDMLSIQECE